MELRISALHSLPKLCNNLQLQKESCILYPIDMLKLEVNEENEENAKSKRYWSAKYF
jgi:hypothetical protein